MMRRDTVEDANAETQRPATEKVERHEAGKPLAL